MTFLSDTFYSTTRFNQPLSGWDTSHVTNLYRTFPEATYFNQPLSEWDTSRVTAMTTTFILQLISISRYPNGIVQRDIVTIDFS